MTDTTKLLERIRQLEADCSAYGTNLAILEAENEQLHNILAALRYPSEAVLMAAKLGMEESWPLRQVAIPADWYARALEDAVAAAEQEVDA